MNITPHLKTKGFTLVELLVVIAIIGILSSVVIVAVQKVRSKAVDIAIMTEVRQMRQVFEELYSTNYAAAYNLFDPLICDSGSGGLVCTVDEVAECPSGNLDLQMACLSILERTGTSTNNFIFGSTEGVDNYSIAAYLPGSNTFFCVGSSGRTAEGVPSLFEVIDNTSPTPGCANNP